MGHILDMEVGLALPTMADGWSRRTWVDWCRIIDDGPFSSVSCGERIAFHNPEMLTTLAGAAALTERVRVMVNLAIAPWHATAMLAKQLATLDVLSAGRLDVGLGVGGREQDYLAVGASMARRHERLDAQVAELRRLWAAEPPVEGAPALGPTPVQAGGPPLLIGATGPKALRRAARWAVGVSAFSFSLDVHEVRDAANDIAAAWADTEPEVVVRQPRLLVACFYALDRDEPRARAELERFTYAYLEVFGRRFAAGQAQRMQLWNRSALGEALDALRSSRLVDEVILVPATTDPRCAELTAELIA